MENPPVSGIRPIPFFSVKVFNTIDDYERFRNVRTYLQQKIDAYYEGKIVSEANHSLMVASGYAKYEKFLNHCYNWDFTGRRIPLSYLNALGVEFNVLDCAREADQKEFEAALLVPRYPKAAIIRVFAAMYSDLKFGHRIPEKIAIEKARAFSREKRVRVCINYGSLLSLWIEPNGKDTVTYYPPKYTITKCWLVPLVGGELNGLSWM